MMPTTLNGLYLQSAADASTLYERTAYADARIESIEVKIANLISQEAKLRAERADIDYRLTELTNYANARLETVDANLVDMDHRVQRIELPIEQLETSDEPQNVAEARAIIVKLELDLMRSITRGLAGPKHDWFEGLRDEDVEELEPLPALTTRANVTLYIAAVTDRLLKKQITGPEAKALLYAAQVAMQSLKVAG